MDSKAQNLNLKAPYSAGLAKMTSSRLTEKKIGSKDKVENDRQGHYQSLTSMDNNIHTKVHAHNMKPMIYILISISK